MSKKLKKKKLFYVTEILNTDKKIILHQIYKNVWKGIFSELTPEEQYSSHLDISK